MPTVTYPFDPAAYLDSEEAIATYLTDALDSNDPGFIADAIGVLAHARGMTQVAREAGLSRESLKSDARERRQSGIEHAAARSRRFGSAAVGPACGGVTG